MALVKRQADPIQWHHSVAFGPSYLSDEQGLPIIKNKNLEPLWVRQRRKFLNKLSISEQNRILTGDPAFRFDTVPYDGTFTLFNHFPPNRHPAGHLPQPPGPPAPPVPYHAAHGRPLHPHHRTPNRIQPFVPIFRTPPRLTPVWPQPEGDPTPHSPTYRYMLNRTSPPPHFDSQSSSSSSGPPCAAASPPAASAPPRPPGRPPKGPDVDGATALMSRFSTTDRPGEHWLRSQPGQSSRPQPFQTRSLVRTPPTSMPPASASRSSSWRDRFSNLMENIFPDPAMTDDPPLNSAEPGHAWPPGYDRLGRPVPRGSPSRRGTRGRPR